MGQTHRQTNVNLNGLLMPALLLCVLLQVLIVMIVCIRAQVNLSEFEGSFK